MRVTPFGSPGINGCLLLPPAYRSLPRPSSPSGSQASTINLYSLDHIIFSFLTRAFPRSFKPAPVAPGLRGHTPGISNLLQDLKLASFGPLSALPFLPSLFVSKIIELKTFDFSVRLEIRGFEPLTLGLQSRCSSQLSYIPGFYR